MTNFLSTVRRCSAPCSAGSGAISKQCTFAIFFLYQSTEVTCTLLSRVRAIVTDTAILVSLITQCTFTTFSWCGGPVRYRFVQWLCRLLLPTLSPRTGVRVFGLDGGCGRGTERVELTGSAVLSLRVGHFRGPLPVCSACTVRDPASSAIYACSTTSTTSTPHLRCPVACVVRHQRLLTYSRACTWSSTCYSAPTTQTARAATTTVTGPRLSRRQDSAYRLKSV